MPGVFSQLSTLPWKAPPCNTTRVRLMFRLLFNGKTYIDHSSSAYRAVSALVALLSHRAQQLPIETDVRPLADSSHLQLRPARRQSASVVHVWSLTLASRKSFAILAENNPRMSSATNLIPNEPISDFVRSILRLNVDLFPYLYHEALSFSIRGGVLTNLSRHQCHVSIHHWSFRSCAQLGLWN